MEDKWKVFLLLPFHLYIVTKNPHYLSQNTYGTQIQQCLKMNVPDESGINEEITNQPRHYKIIQMVTRLLNGNKAVSIEIQKKNHWSLFRRLSDSNHQNLMLNMIIFAFLVNFLKPLIWMYIIVIFIVSPIFFVHQPCRHR